MDSDDSKSDAHDTYNKPHCNGRACSKCGKCRDWYYIGDLESWRWIQDCKKWTKKDWNRWHKERVYNRFQKRYGATCHRNSRTICGYGDENPASYRDHFLLLLCCTCCCDYFDTHETRDNDGYKYFGCLCDDNIKRDF